METTISAILEGDLAKHRDLNCAEALLYASNEALKLGLDSQALKLAAGFGGGLGIGHVCGALTGAVMVLGRLYVKERSHESQRIKEVEQRLIAAFEQDFGSLMCTPLKERYRDPEQGCKAIIVQAAKRLEEVLAQEPRPA